MKRFLVPELMFMDETFTGASFDRKTLFNIVVDCSFSFLCSLERDNSLDWSSGTRIYVVLYINIMYKIYNVYTKGHKNIFIYI